MQESKTYVRADEHGVLRVGSNDVMLDSVFASFQQGFSAETIQQQYPSLNLEEVYGAITWCLANAEEVANYLERQASVWDGERAKAATHPSPVLQRLRAFRNQRVAAAL